MVHLRTLTDDGIRRFQEFIDSMSTTEPESFDMEVVDRHSKSIKGAPEVPITCDFANRFEAAEYLSRIVAASGLEDPEFSRGLWCWLSWIWFESICTPDRSGARKPGESARWVLNLDWNRYYRHLLAGPWWIYRAHKDNPERARSLLCTPLASPGELVGQIAARQELVANRGLVETITNLYYDPVKAKLKRGHGTKGAGSARRIADVADQLDMIWDLYSASPGELAELLPAEFDKFK